VADHDFLPVIAREENEVKPMYRRDAPRPLAVAAVAVRFLPGLDPPCLDLLDEAHRVAASLVPW
jgi:hypothetical protein